MLTLDQAMRTLKWQTGEYIDWDGVFVFLRHMAEYVIDPDEAGVPEPLPPDMAATWALEIITCLEMILGPDIYWRRVLGPKGISQLAPNKWPTFPFSNTDILKLLSAIAAGQAGRSEPNSCPGGQPESGDPASGRRGWWGIVPGQALDRLLHYSPTSARMYMTLRRNTMGLTAIHGFPAPPGGEPTPPDFGVPPIGLEHKLLPSGWWLDNPVPPHQPNGSQCGGLVTDQWQPWLDDLFTAGALHTEGNCNGYYSPPHLLDGPYSNFWGEMQGAVILARAMEDKARDLVQLAFPTEDPLGTVPPVNTTTGIGGAVAACFDAWRASEDDFAAFCDAYVELGACSAEWWAGDDVAALNPNVAWDTVSWTATAGEGQPWDVNLAQMARAVNAMHHLGYSLSPEDRLRIFVRVYCWRAAMCGMVQMLSLFDPPQGGVNTYGWTNHAPPDGTGAPSSELCADGTAFKGRAPGAPEVLEGVMAIVRGGLDIPWALGPSPFLESFRDAIVGDIALSSLRTVAALYRVGLETPFPDTPGHFWLSVDTGNGYPWTVGASDAPTGDSGQSWWRQPEATFKRRALGGTYTAIISLMLSDRASLFPGCAATSSLTGYPGRAPQTGLDSFYSLFGSSAVHSSPPSWGAGYVPG